MLNRFRTRWKLFVLASSYAFYGYWDIRFIALLAGSTIVNHAAAVAIARSRSNSTRRFALSVAVLADIGALAYFKYYGFLVTSVANGLRPFGVRSPLPLLQIVLPVGISFFTFMAI